MDSNDISVKIFKALGHPIRLKIVKFLLAETRCVCELHRNFEFSQANLSQHLRILKEAGILKNEKVGVEVHYSVNLKGIEPLLDAMDTLTHEYYSTLKF